MNQYNQPRGYHQQSPGLTRLDQTKLLTLVGMQTENTRGYDMAHEQHPDKLFLPLDDELRDSIESPFGVLEYMTGDTIYESPFYVARYVEGGEEQDMMLHWFNTTVRLFRNKPWATHIDVRDDGQVRGVMAEDELVEAMLELHYPKHESPFLDPATVKWLADRAIDGGGDLDDELRDL